MLGGFHIQTELRIMGPLDFGKLSTRAEEYLFVGLSILYF